MRPYVIVTVQDAQGTFHYDVEVPTDVKAKKLEEDITQTLNSYSRKHPVQGQGGLFCQRLKRRLGPEETLAQAGVWTGDIMEIS